MQTGTKRTLLDSILDQLLRDEVLIEKEVKKRARARYRASIFESELMFRKKPVALCNMFTCYAFKPRNTLHPVNRLRVSLKQDF